MQRLTVNNVRSCRQLLASKTLRNHACRPIVTSSASQGSNQKWYESLSFASPEADYTATRSITSLSDNAPEREWSHYLSFASPESDFTYGVLYFPCFYAYSMASTENEFSNPTFMNLLNDTMKDQLKSTQPIQEETSLSEHVIPRELSPLPSIEDFDNNVMEEVAAPVFSRSQLFHEDPLPRNLSEASLPGDPRAIVITEAHLSYRIVSVNDAWENLCGYSQNECKGDTLACIQGPETNVGAVRSLVSQVMRGEEAGTLLTNYTKEGRKFHNRLRVGPLKNDSGKITHFVGVLKEVNEIGEQFNGEMMHA